MQITTPWQQMKNLLSRLVHFVQTHFSNLNAISIRRLYTKNLLNLTQILLKKKVGRNEICIFCTNSLQIFLVDWLYEAWCQFFYTLFEEIH